MTQEEIARKAEEKASTELQTESISVPIPLNPFTNLKHTPKSWDLGLAYKPVKSWLEHMVRTESNLKRYSGYAILLIQIGNAARVSEAVEAWNAFLGNGVREHHVRVRKRKDNELRRIRIPEVIIQKGVVRNADQIITFTKRLGANTHSMRYALVGYLSTVEKLPPQVIAKITHHTKLDMILKYTQQALADEVLDNTAK